MKKTIARRASVTFDDVREIALSMPDVEETTAYGMPAFKAGKTRFAGQPVQRAEIEPHTLGVMIGLADRDRLLAARPDIYYLTEHFANYPAVLVRLDNMTKSELRELLGTAWCNAMERQRPTNKLRAKR
jgi:hypothetical protein